MSWSATPVVARTCGSCASLSTNLSESGAPLNEPRIELSLGRKRRSAPTPSLRFSELSRNPWVMPTSVRIRVTEPAISRTLSKVRAGRKRIFSQTSLKITLFRRSDHFQLGIRGLIQHEFVGAQSQIHLQV